MRLYNHNIHITQCAEQKGVPKMKKNLKIVTYDKWDNLAPLERKQIAFLKDLLFMLDEYYFSHELLKNNSTREIAIYPSKKKYMHYNYADNKGIINISTAIFKLSLRDIAILLLHEMVHIYNNEIKNVQDTSNKGIYHNDEFLKTCIEIGFEPIDERDKKKGWHTAIWGDFELSMWLFSEVNYLLETLKEISTAMK